MVEIIIILTIKSQVTTSYPISTYLDSLQSYRLCRYRVGLADDWPMV